MTPHSAAALGAFLLAVAFTHAHVSTSQLMLKGSVSCLDCTKHDLSGVKLAVKCDNEKKPTYALTDKNGKFASTIPTNSLRPSSFSDCQVRILGGPIQICARKRSVASKIVKVRGEEDSYGLSNPLTFFTKCPSQAQHPPVTDEKAPGSDSPSPTIGFPPPANWSSIPLIYLFPFIPIIGIP